MQSLVERFSLFAICRTRLFLQLAPGAALDVPFPSGLAATSDAVGYMPFPRLTGHIAARRNELNFRVVTARRKTVVW